MILLWNGKPSWHFIFKPFNKFLFLYKAIHPAEQRCLSGFIKQSTIFYCEYPSRRATEEDALSRSCVTWQLWTSNTLDWALFSPSGEVHSMAPWALHIIYHWSFKLPSHTSHFDVKRRLLYRPPLILLDNSLPQGVCILIHIIYELASLLTWHR